MKITKRKSEAITVALVSLVVFNVIAFAAPFKRTSSFWIGYVFTMFAFILAFFAFGYALKDKPLQSKFYGIPIAAMAWRYLVIQVIAGFVFMTASMIPSWIAVIVCVLVLAFGISGCIAGDVAKDEVERVEKKVADKTFYIKSLQSDVEGMAARTEDAVLRKELKNIAEAFRYSDPMSSDQLATLEDKIEAKTAELGQNVEAGDIEGAKAMCKEIQQLIIERSNKCRILK
jgi:hypothetical protein